MPKCPKCSSHDIELYMYQLVEVIKCNSCGFDEGSAFDETHGQKKSQKAKGDYSVYKTGGSRRSAKKK